MSTTKTELRQ